MHRVFSLMCILVLVAGIASTATSGTIRTPAHYRVFAGGDIFYVDPFNWTWHGNLHEYRTNYTSQTYGFYYKTCIYIINQGGMSLGWYFLFLQEKKTRTIFNKNQLPYQFIIYNFTGSISLSYYYHPHGSMGCGFRLIGNAESYAPYNPFPPLNK